MFFLLAFCLVLVLARRSAEMTGLAKHPPIQRIAAMFVWFRRELDDTALQETQEQGILACASGFVQNAVCSLIAYLASVAVLVVGVPQAFDNVAVSAIFFWNDQVAASVAFRSIFPLWVCSREENIC